MMLLDEYLEQKPRKTILQSGNFDSEKLDQYAGRVFSYNGMSVYYVDNGVLLETKTLEELIRHHIRDQMCLFSVFHPCE